MVATAGTETGKKAAGRTGRDGQEAVTQPKLVGDYIDELEQLYMKAQAANKALNDGIKKIAEKTGYVASNLRAFVSARVGDKVADKKRNCAQQLELYEEVGE
jgi:hypothetical protein